MIDLSSFLLLVDYLPEDGYQLVVNYLKGTITEVYHTVCFGIYVFGKVVDRGHLVSLDVHHLQLYRSKLAETRHFHDVVRTEIEVLEVGGVHLAKRVHPSEMVAPQPELLEGFHFG